MATFAPSRLVPAGAFFPICRCCQSWAIAVPFGPHCIGPLMVVGHENQPGMSGPFFIASVHASFGEYPEEFFRACLRPSLAVNKTARGLHVL